VIQQTVLYQPASQAAGRTLRNRDFDALTRTFITQQNFVFHTNNTTVSWMPEDVAHARQRISDEKGSHCKLSLRCDRVVDYVWNVTSPAQKPDFVFRRNGRVHLTFRRRIKSRLPFAGIIRKLPYSTCFQDVLN